MNSKKTLIAVLMAALLVFAFAGIATAAEFSDEEIAAKRLMAIDVVKGDPDGNLRLDDGITRAEFAAIVVRLRGMEGAANSAKGATQFPDVKIDQWYTGYINLASGRGIIKGDPAGTFRPNEQVNYAEAAAMLVRVLGYEPAVQAAGANWPNNYLSKSGELGVLDDVKMTDWKAPARRGDVFTMADNSLDVDLMEQKSYGTEIKYEEVDDNLLTKYHDVKVYDDKDGKILPMVVETAKFNAKKIKPNEVRLANPVDEDDKKTGATGTFKVKEWIDVEEFLGQKVEVWIDDDDYVLYMEADKDMEVIIDEIDGKIEDRGRIPLDDDGGKYDVLDDAIIYVDNETKYNGKDFLNKYKGKNDFDEEFIRLVLNDDRDIIFAEIKTYSNKDGLLDETYIVKDVDVDDEYIDRYTLTGKERGLDLDDDDYVILKDGVYTDSLEVLEKGDLLIVMKDEQDNYFLEAFSAEGFTVKGEVKDYERKKTDNEGLDDYILWIEDEKYDVAYNVLYTDDEFDNVDDLDRSDVEELVGLDVYAYFNPMGDIVAVSVGESISGAKNYGVIVSDATPEYRGDKYTMTILNDKGKEIDFTFDPEDVRLKYFVNANNKKVTKDMDEKLDGKEIIEYFKNCIKNCMNKEQPLLIKYKMAKDGDLKEIELLSAIDGTPFKYSDKDYYTGGDTSNKGQYKIDDDDNLLIAKGSHYDATNKTIVFDLTGDLKKIPGNFGEDFYEIDEPDVAKWEDLDGDDKMKFTYLADKDKLSVLLVTYNEHGKITSNALYGMVHNYGKVNGEDGTIILTPDNELKRYENEVAERRSFIKYELDGDEIDTAKVDVLAYKDTPVSEQAMTIEDINALRHIDYAAFAIVENDDTDVIKGYTYEDIKSYLDSEGKENIESRRDLDNVRETNFKIAKDAVRYFIDDGKIVNRANRDSLVLLIDDDDDGSAIDYVVVIRDDIKVEEYLENIRPQNAKVNDPVKITTKDAVELEIGETKTLEVTTVPTTATLEFKSANEDVATVNDKGLVTAKAEGKTTITITATAKGYKSATAKVEVNVVEEKDTTEATIEAPKSALRIGSEAFIKVTVTSGDVTQVVAKTADDTVIGTLDIENGIVIVDVTNVKSGDSIKLHPANNESDVHEVVIY